MLTTVDALRAELGDAVDDGVSDATLAGVIRTQSAAVERYCRRRFALRTVTDRLRIEHRPKSALPLSVLPVMTVTSVVQNGAPLMESGYELDEPRDGGEGSGLLYRLSGSDRRICWTCGTVVVIYEAGYLLPGVTGYDLPASIERACLDLCVRAWATRGRDPTLRSYENPDVERFAYTAADSVTTRGGLPLDVAERLDAYRMVVVR